MSEWQPIETAPYDTLVLCWADNWNWPRVLRRKNGRWDDETSEESHKPQYWVRIPEPPPA